jgi:uncharacterized YigZ family protein
MVKPEYIWFNGTADHHMITEKINLDNLPLNINTLNGEYRDRNSKIYPTKIHRGKQPYDARHQCYAWILGYNKETYRYNDDGEPSGTAGKPIYGQLLSNDLTNTVIVVIRYFGGIKLGVRGLINAYKFAAQDALVNNIIQTRIIHDIYQVKFAYEHMNHVMRILKEEELDQIDQDFHLTCSIDFSVRSSRADYVVTRFNDLRMVELTFLRRE